MQVMHPRLAEAVRRARWCGAAEPQQKVTIVRDDAWRAPPPSSVHAADGQPRWHTPHIKDVTPATESIRLILAMVKPEWSADRIVNAVCDVYRVTHEQISGDSRRHEILEPRHIAFTFVKVLKNWSFPRVANHFGRDHTTIMNATRKWTAAIHHAQTSCEFPD